MSERPIKTNTRGNSLNRKAPVTISTWDEQKSSVRRLRRPYVTDGESSRPVTLASPAELNTSSPVALRPARPASFDGSEPSKRTSRPTSLTHSDFDYGRSMVLNQSRQGFRSFEADPTVPTAASLTQKDPPKKAQLSVRDAVQTLPVEAIDDYGRLDWLTMMR